MDPSTPRTLLWTALSIVILAGNTARGGELSGEQVAARRQLIEQAQAAHASGDHGLAVDLATRAGELQMSVSLRRFIAEEQLAAGQPAAALGSAELCVREARSDGGTAAEHGAACEVIVEKAKPLVAYLVIRARPSVSSIRITVDGKLVPVALLGQRYVVSPSDVRVVATADGYRNVERTVRAERGKEVAVDLVLSPLPAPRKKATAAPPPRGEFYLSPLLPIGGAVAVTGGAVALGVGVSGRVKLDDYEERCTSPGALSGCTTEQQDLQNDLDTRAVVVNVALGLAAAGLVAGTIGVFLSGTSDEQQAALWQGKVLF